MATGLFWTAPEALRYILQKQPFKHTQAGDIYAVGIIIKELVCRNEPYCDNSDLSPKGNNQPVLWDFGTSSQEILWTCIHMYQLGIYVKILTYAFI